MMMLSNNPVLLSLSASNTRSIVAHVEAVIEAKATEDKWINDEATRQMALVVDALRKRRERRWNKALGRRADGHVIRPIQAGRFRFPRLLSPVALRDLRETLVAEIAGAGRDTRCDAGEGCKRRTVARSVDGLDYALCGYCTALMSSVEGHTESQFHDFESWAREHAC